MERETGLLVLVLVLAAIVGGVLCRLMLSVAWGGPYLTCDAQDGATHYEVRDKVSGAHWMTDAIDGALLFDLEKVPFEDYQHRARSIRLAVRACSGGVCSEPARVKIRVYQDEHCLMYRVLKPETFALREVCHD